MVTGAREFGKKHVRRPTLAASGVSEREAKGTVSPHRTPHRRWGGSEKSGQLGALRSILLRFSRKHMRPLCHVTSTHWVCRHRIPLSRPQRTRSCVTSMSSYTTTSSLDIANIVLRRALSRPELTYPGENRRLTVSTFRFGHRLPLAVRRGRATDTHHGRAQRGPIYFRHPANCSSAGGLPAPGRIVWERRRATSGPKQISPTEL